MKAWEDDSVGWLRAPAAVAENPGQFPAPTAVHSACNSSVLVPPWALHANSGLTCMKTLKIFEVYQVYMPLSPALEGRARRISMCPKPARATWKDPVSHLSLSPTKKDEIKVLIQAIAQMRPGNAVLMLGIILTHL